MAGRTVDAAASLAQLTKAVEVEGARNARTKRTLPSETRTSRTRVVLARGPSHDVNWSEKGVATDFRPCMVAWGQQ